MHSIVPTLHQHVIENHDPLAAERQKHGEKIVSPTNYQHVTTAERTWLSPVRMLLTS